MSLTSVSARQARCLLYNTCIPKRLCMNQIFMLGDSSNLNFFTYAWGKSNSFSDSMGSIILFKEPYCEFSLWLDYWFTN